MLSLPKHERPRYRGSLIFRQAQDEEHRDGALSLAWRWQPLALTLSLSKHERPQRRGSLIFRQAQDEALGACRPGVAFRRDRRAESGILRLQLIPNS